MTTLLEFIEARLTEDERVTRRIESAWRCLSGTGEIVASDGTNAEVCAEAHWEGVGEHMARHDPARVLHEVAAKRRLVQQILEYESQDDAERGCSHTAEQIAAGECPVKPEQVLALRLVASVWSDHEAYRPEWSP